MVKVYQLSDKGFRYFRIGQLSLIVLLSAGHVAVVGDLFGDTVSPQFAPGGKHFGGRGGGIVERFGFGDAPPTVFTASIVHNCQERVDTFSRLAVCVGVKLVG